MANNKKVKLSPEEQRASAYKQATSNLNHLPEPTYSLNIGERVSVGCLKDAVVFGIFEEGKLYEIDYTNVDGNYGKPIETPHCKRFFPWFSVRPIIETTESLIIEDDTFFRYLQQDIRSLLHKIYYFGVDFNPEYQRDYVWNQEDKESLIDSIFNNIEIGKFVFIQNDFPSENLFEILDGKQRLITLKDFFENRFTYKGKYFNELSIGDRDYFERFSVNVAETNQLTREQKIKYFLKLNKSGRIMSPDDLKRAEELLKKI